MGETVFGVGIDLGTSNSSVCRVRLEGVRTVFEEAHEQAGHHEIPSIIYVEEGGRLVCGSPALSHATKPEGAHRLISEMKLMLRSREPIIIGDEILDPLDVMRTYLAHLKACFEQSVHDGRKLDRAVVTVPAYEQFDLDYRAAVRQSATAADGTPLFDRLDFLEEPDAALFSVGALSDFEGQNVLVFDMGGGTLDVTVRHVEFDGEIPQLTALGLSGSATAGGMVTRALLDLLLARWSEETGREFTAEEMEALKRTNFSWVDNGKISLSSQMANPAYAEGSSQVHINLVSLSNTSYQIVLHERDLVRVCEPVVAQAADVVRNAVADAGLSLSEVDSYFLVGGSTQLRPVGAMLEQLFGKPPAPMLGYDGSHVPRRNAVVRGAALYDLQREDAEVAPESPIHPGQLRLLPSLERILPYDVSIAVTRGGRELAELLIPKGTSIPTAVIERQVYMPSGGGAYIDLVLYRGQGDPSICDSLKERRLHFDVPKETSAPITVAVQIDGNGEISLSADDEGIQTIATIKGA